MGLMNLQIIHRITFKKKNNRIDRADEIWHSLDRSRRDGWRKHESRSCQILCTNIKTQGARDEKSKSTDSFDTQQTARISPMSTRFLAIAFFFALLVPASVPAADGSQVANDPAWRRRDAGKVIEMKALLEKLITDGRSTPGAAQKNDVEVKRFPAEAEAKAKSKRKQS
jgi:hypothetical protein